MSEVNRSPEAVHTRRRALCQLAAFMAGSPFTEWAALAAQAPAGGAAGRGARLRRRPRTRPGVVRPPAYRERDHEAS